MNDIISSKRLPFVGNRKFDHIPLSPGYLHHPLRRTVEGATCHKGPDTGTQETARNAGSGYLSGARYNNRRRRVVDLIAEPRSSDLHLEGVLP